ncbi:MAG: Uma2 family endonuclease, partial [Sphaerospermopsis kisseleviana]
SYLNNPDQVWLRWWDNQGNLLLVGKEEAQLERLRTEQQQQRAEQAEIKAAKLAERLRAMGIDPDDDL